jgi:hypothetical protein
MLGRAKAKAPTVLAILLRRRFVNLARASASLSAVRICEQSESDRHEDVNNGRHQRNNRIELVSSKKGRSAGNVRWSHFASHAL